MDHPNIIRMLEFKTDGVRTKPNKKDSVTYITLEFAEGGQMFDFIKFSGCGFSERICRFYFNQLI